MVTEMPKPVLALEIQPCRQAETHNHRQLMYAHTITQRSRVHTQAHTVRVYTRNAGERIHAQSHTVYVCTRNHTQLRCAHTNTHSWAEVSTLAVPLQKY
jgi:hypothetical protein